MTIPPKSRDLAALVDRLRSDLGDNYFTKVPYWDGDQTAIGLASPADLRFLVYLSVQPGDAAVYLTQPYTWSASGRPGKMLQTRPTK